MKKLSQAEKEKILSRIYWDVDVNANELLEKLNEISDDPTDLRIINFCRRLLTSCDWYTLIKLMPVDNIRKMLTITVIEGIHPKELKARFQYARSVL